MLEQLQRIRGDEPLPPSEDEIAITNRHLEEHAAMTVADAMRPVESKLQELEKFVRQAAEANQRLGARVEELTAKLYRLESDGAE